MLAPGSKVSRRLIRESQARRLIGGNVPLLAPGCEGTRTNPDPGDTETGLLKLLFSKFGTLQPSVVSRRQLVGVAEQFQQSRIIATGIPRQRNDGRRCPQFILPRHLNQDLMSWLFHQGWVNGRKLSRVKNGAGKGEVWTPLRGPFPTCGKPTRKARTQIRRPTAGRPGPAPSGPRPTGGPNAAAWHA